MLGIPGQDPWYHAITNQTKCGYFSLKQAEELGISIHGSQEAMDSFISKTRKVRTSERLLVRWLSGATLDSEPQLSSIFAMDSDSPRDDFSGVASINFPSLRPDGELEDGLWCFGCRNTYALRHAKIKNDNDPPLSPLESARFLGMYYQARSRSGFLEHAKDCEAATLMFRHSEILDEDDEMESPREDSIRDDEGFRD